MYDLGSSTKASPVTLSPRQKACCSWLVGCVHFLCINHLNFAYEFMETSPVYRLTGSAYDLDVILAEEEKIKVRFERNVDWCGFLFAGANGSFDASSASFLANDAQSSAEENVAANIQKGTIVSAPLWLVKHIKQTKNSAGMLSVCPNKLCSPDTVHWLAADACGLNFYEKSRYFMLVTCWIARIMLASSEKEIGSRSDDFGRISFAPQLFNALLAAYYKRIKTIYHNANRDEINVEWLAKLDIVERKAYANLRQHYAIKLT